jgi:hypothetical protein
MTRVPATVYARLHPANVAYTGVAKVSNERDESDSAIRRPAFNHLR